MELVVAQVTQTVIRFVATFGEIALNGPVTALLLLFGAVITIFSSAFFGYLAAGAALDLLTGAGGFGRSPPPGAK